MFKRWFNNLVGINWRDNCVSNHTTLYMFHFLRGAVTKDDYDRFFNYKEDK